jgi:hypothetical protein
MEFQEEVSSKVLSKEEYKACFEEIIQILTSNQHKKVDILFGVAWGNEYKDWTPFSVPVYNIAHEITVAEQLNVGRFGEDDFYLILTSIKTEILFCHEMDIHLRYQQKNPITETIVESWKANDLVCSVKTNSA